MRETLLIRLSGSTEAAWRTLAPHDDDVVADAGTLDEAMAQCRNRRVVVLVPGTEVLLCTASVPGLTGQKLRQALPYAIEDELAEDVEALHFALGAVTEDGRRAVAVVARRHMEAWLAPFHANGIEPDAIYPETLCVPRPEKAASSWALLLEQEQILVRTGVHSGFACEVEMLGDMTALAPADEYRHVLVHARSEDRARAEDLTASLEAASTQVANYADPLACLARGVSGHVIDLRQGAYAIRRGWQRWGLPFRATALLLLTLFVIHMGILGARYIRLSRQHAALRTQARQTFRQLFPKSTRIEDIQAQTQAHLNALLKSGNANTGLFFLLDKTAQALQATPQLSVQQLEYHQNALFISLHGSDLGDLETLRQKFSAEHGVTLQVQSANSGDNGVQLRLRIGVAST